MSSISDSAVSAHQAEVGRLKGLMSRYCMWLRVPFDDENSAALVQTRTYPGMDKVPPVPIGDQRIVHTLISELHHVHCHRVFERSGWKEFGLDGDKADWYSFRM